MSAPPQVVVDYDTRFVPVDLDGNLRSWARASAEVLWQRTGMDHKRRDVSALAERLEAVAEVVRGVNPMGAFALVPEPWSGVTGVARLLPVDLGEPMTTDEVLRSMTYPDAELVEPAEIAEIETPLGTAHVLHQRVVHEGAVADQRQVVWLFPEREAALILGIAFTDLIEAERWRDAVVDLARGVVLDPAVPTPR